MTIYTHLTYSYPQKRSANSLTHRLAQILDPRKLKGRMYLLQCREGMRKDFMKFPRIHPDEAGATDPYGYAPLLYFDSISISTQTILMNLPYQ